MTSKQGTKKAFNSHFSAYFHPVILLLVRWILKASFPLLGQSKTHPGFFAVVIYKPRLTASIKEYGRKKSIILWALLQQQNDKKSPLIQLLVHM